MSWVQQMYYFPHSKSLLPANLRCLEFGWSTYLSQRGKREKWRSSGSKSKLTIFSSVTVKKKGKREFPPLRRNRRRGKREERERESEKDGERGKRREKGFDFQRAGRKGKWERRMGASESWTQPLPPPAPPPLKWLYSIFLYIPCSLREFRFLSLGFAA